MNKLLKKASTQELEDLMAILLTSETLTPEQMELLDDIAAEEMGRGEYKKNTEVETREAYRRLLRRIEAISADETHISGESVNTAQRAVGFRRGRGILRPALIAAVAVIALFLTNAAALGAGFDFFGSVAKWSENAVYFIFGTPRNDVEIQQISGESGYKTLYAMLDSIGIHAKLPSHIPEGYILDVIEPDESDEFLSIVAWFIRGDDMFSIKVQRVAENHSLFFESDGEETSTIYKDKYMVVPNNNRMKAIWFEGNVSLCIQGNLTLEELTQILDSI
jgi:hypothetical protein